MTSTSQITSSQINLRIHILPDWEIHFEDNHEEKVKDAKELVE